MSTNFISSYRSNFPIAYPHRTFSVAAGLDILGGYKLEGGMSREVGSRRTTIDSSVFVGTGANVGIYNEGVNLGFSAGFAVPVYKAQNALVSVGAKATLMRAFGEEETLLSAQPRIVFDQLKAKKGIAFTAEFSLGAGFSLIDDGGHRYLPAGGGSMGFRF
jgi:hypothetical protein